MRPLPTARTFFSLLALFVVSAAIFLHLANMALFATEMDVVKRLLLFLLVLALVLPISTVAVGAATLLFVPARRHAHYSWSLDDIIRIEKNVQIVAINTLPIIGFVFLLRRLKRADQLMEMFGTTVHSAIQIAIAALVITTLAATFGIAATLLWRWRQSVTKERWPYSRCAARLGH